MKCFNHTTSRTCTTSLLLLTTLVLALLLGPCLVLSDSTREFEVDENEEAGITIGYVDGSPSRGLYLTLVSRGPAFDEDIFVDKDTGEIRTKVPLDRERRNFYSLVAIPPSGNNTLVQIYVRDVNDNSPQFSQKMMTTSFSENTPRTVKRTLIPARDPDLGIFSTQEYSIISGNENDAFVLSPHRGRDGVLYLDLQINRILDRESTPSYELLIEAKDGGSPPLKSTMELLITIEDVNDNQPIFGQSRYSATIPENTTIGTIVQKVLATDTDSGRNQDITYSINRRHSNRDQLFRVDPKSGEIIVNRPLDFETEHVHELIVVARDNGTQPLETSAFVSITVQNVNDNLPNINIVFLSDDASPKISEQANAGDYVARISVSDPDTKEEYDSLEDLTLRGGGGTFRLEKHDDVIYLMVVEKPLDREQYPHYNLTVTARDRGNPPLQASRSFVLHVTDANDNAPRFDRDTYRANLPEMALPGTEVVKLTAHDQDSGVNALLHFSIEDSGGVASTSDLNSGVPHSRGWFQVDPDSGLVTTRTRVDCESDAAPKLTVVVTDSGTPRLSSTATLLVTIFDFNDNEPVFDQSFYNVSVREDRFVGQCILNVSATDSDCGVHGEVSYSLAPEAGAAWRQFSIDNETGYICLAAALDREKRAFYEFPVIATDRGGLTTVAMVKLHVLDVNDNSPQFYPRHYNASVVVGRGVGELPREPIVVVAATDPDDGDLGQVTYQITAGNDHRLFRIDEITGEVFVARAVRHAGAIYRLKVSARDGGGRTAVVPAVVTLSTVDWRRSQQAPTFERARYAFAVREDVAVGWRVGVVHATVPANGGVVRYSIYSGDPDEEFIIDTISGVVRIAGPLDRERRAFYLLNVQAASSSPISVYGHTQLNVSVVDVNDVSPHFDSTHGSLSVSESTAVGAAIYTARANDADVGANGRLVYRLLSAVIEQGNATKTVLAGERDTEEEQSEDVADMFSVEPESGRIVLLKQLDFERRRRYRLVIEARDSGTPLTRAANLTLSVNVHDANDNAPQFTTHEVGSWPTSGGVSVRASHDEQSGGTVVIEVREDQMVNTPLVQLRATDADTGNNARLTYRLLTPTSADTAPLFGVFPTTGWLYLRAPLDRERATTHQLIARVSDSAVPRLTAETRLLVHVTDANDHRPHFSSSLYHMQVPEGASLGTVVGRVEATDRDLAGVGFNNDVQLRYNIHPSNDNNTFTVDPLTGIVRTAAILDRESRDDYEFTVLVSDQGSPPKQNSASVQVSVLDENDETPEFVKPLESVIRVREELPAGFQVVQVRAVDADLGVNGTVTYSLAAGDGDDSQSTFVIDERTGIVSTTRVLDHEVQSVYSLRVFAVDGGSPQLRAVKELRVRVLDLNDNSPVFTTSTVSFTIVENVPIGYEVGHVVATDLDAGENGRVAYTILSGNWNDTFDINRSTGALFTTREVDYEMASRYEIRIEAVDSSATNPQNGRITVTVNVEDVNDNWPTFADDLILFSVAESVPVGSNVWNFTATDRDSGMAGSVRYSLSQQLPAAVFSIDSVTGTLSTTHALDYELHAEYTIVVTATDRGQPDPLSSSITSQVIIGDVNDNAPVFVRGANTSASTGSESTCTVRADERIGFPVLHVIAVDQDARDNGRVQYRLQPGDGVDYFRLHPETGLLSVAAPLQPLSEPVVLNITASDHGLPTQSTTLSVTVNVRAGHSDWPVFTRRTHHVTVSEQAPIGSELLQLRVQVPPGRERYTRYRLPDGIGNGTFTVDAVSGLLVNQRLFDRESVATYRLAVIVYDVTRPQLYDVTAVTVNVDDANDNTPQITSGCYPLRVPENAEPAVIHTVAASDADTGVNAEVMYSITDGNVGNMFDIDANSGAISAKSLDREQRGVFSLEVTAVDGGSTARRATCRLRVTVVDQNDNGPVFESRQYQAHISERAALGTLVTTVRAVDADSGQNGRVIYSLNNETHWLFRIDQETGRITTAGRLDRESRQRFVFEVSAVDGGKYRVHSSTARVTVVIDDANDHVPHFTTFPYRAAVPAAAPRGQPLISVSAIDEDYGENGLITYSIVDSDGGSFFINSNTGEIRTAAAYRSYRSDSVYNLKVRASDGGSPPRHSDTLVQLMFGNSDRQVALKFQKAIYSVKMIENAAVGTKVVQLSAYSSDARQRRVFYELVPITTIAANTSSSSSMHDRDSGANDLFSVDRLSGEVRVRRANQLDYEQRQTVFLFVQATTEEDSVMPGYVSVVIELLDENDNSPRFTQDEYISSVREGRARGTYIIQVSATDADSYRNSEVVYSIVEGNRDNAFVLASPSSGIVRTNTVLDREVRDSYHLVITASDRGTPSLIGSCSLHIKVIDVNDNRPTFPPYAVVTVDESAEPGSLVTSVTANDIDTNPALIYDFTQGSDGAGVFAIDRFTGRVVLAQRLDRETRDMYTLSVSVSDSRHVAVTNITVRVADNNDHAPVFSRPFYSATLLEQSGPGVQLIQLNASDADLGASARLKYSLLTHTDLFSIDAGTGLISTSASLHQPGDSNQLQLQLVAAVSDQAQPFHTTAVFIQLRVETVNRHSPRFLQPHYSGSISESAAPGAVVLTVQAEDSDQSERGRVYYSFNSGNDHGHFQIASTTGELILVRSLDREQHSRYLLEVVATDGGVPARNTTMPVIVNVLDVNDHEPRFSQSEYTANVSESLQVGSLVTSVIATDADAGVNAELVYDIISGDERGTFVLDPNTGQIRLHRPLDYDTLSEHRFVVRATDSNRQRPLSALASVRVRLSDANDNAPLFPQSVYQQLVQENSPPGTLVFTALASDRDRGRFGLLQYRLGSGGAPWFSVNTSSGAVRTAQPLDRELRAEYQFAVHARDAGGRDSSALVRVSVEDVDEFAPRFTADTFTMRCPADAPARFVCGSVTARDDDAGAQGVVVYHLRTSHRLFAVNRSRGDVVVTHDLSRLTADNQLQSPYSDPEERVRRQLNEHLWTERLVVVASSGRPGSLSSSATVYVQLDPSLNGVGRAGLVDAGLAGWGVGLLIAFVLIAALFVAAFLFLHVRNRQVGKPRLPSLGSRHHEPTSFDLLSPAGSAVAPAALGSTCSSAGGVTELNYPPRYSEIQPYDTSDGRAAADVPHSSSAVACVDHSQRSASSGRGSAEDEEIRMINEAPLLHKLRQLDPMSTADCTHTDTSSHNTQQYLARLGIDTSHLAAPQAGSSGNAHYHFHQSHPHHQLMDLSSLLSSKLTVAGVQENDAIMDGTRTYGDDSQHRTASLLAADGAGAVGATVGSLSSIVHSDHELAGSYSWDYLLNWGPQYQPLAHVFSEIGRLKDDSVPSPYAVSGQQPPPPPSSHLPPPLLTCAPPHLPTCSPLGGTVSTAYLTAEALSPSFSPALSPLDTRPPSIAAPTHMHLVTPSSGGAVKHHLLDHCTGSADSVSHIPL